MSIAGSSSTGRVSYFVMPEHITVLLREDPMTTHRPVEGLRIALGLSTGTTPLSIVLLGKARTLLTDDAGDVVDAEILEKHLPVIQDLEIPILIPEGSGKELDIDPDFSVKEVSPEELASHISTSDRIMVLG